MSSDERLLNLGRLQEHEQAARLLAIKLAARKKQIREHTDPHRPIAELDTAGLRSALDELIDLERLYQQALREIAALRAELGMPRYEVR